MTDSTVMVLGLTSLALVLVLHVWFALALAAMFRKMGEPVWKAWVPVLNVATVLQRGDFSPWLVLLNVIPLFGTLAFAVVFIVAVHRVTVAFGGGAGLTVVGALVPVVWASILGWGPARWSDPVDAGGVEERSGPFRRGDGHAPAYVPLVGGWTPEGPGATDAPGSARSRWTPDTARAERDDMTSGFGSASAVSLPERAGRDSGVLAGPDATPFAAPSPTGAVPTTAEWAPPADPAPVSFEPRRDDASPSGTSDAAPDTSVSDVLMALRDDSLRGPGTLRRGLAVDALQGLSGSDRAGRGSDETTDAGVEVSSGGGAEPIDSLPPVPLERPSGIGSTAEAPVQEWVAPSRRMHRAGGEVAAPVADVPLTRPPSPADSPLRPSDVHPGEEFPELSEAVSAVSGAPDAGSPRSARTSVSSLFAQSPVGGFEDDDVDQLDRTVVTRRKRIPWVLVPPSGAPIALTSDVVVLGRRPVPDAEHPNAQLVAISDETRTVSKTHARLHLRGETWFVTDLDSTNGVLFATLMGTEVEAPPGEEIEAGSRFFLGDAEVRLARSDA